MRHASRCSGMESMITPSRSKMSASGLLDTCGRPVYVSHITCEFLLAFRLAPGHELRVLRGENGHVPDALLFQRPFYLNSLAAEEPEFGEDFRHDVTVAENTNHSRFGDDNRGGVSNPRDTRRGDVAASQPERHRQADGGGVQISARGLHHAIAAHHERSVELRQLFDGASQIRIG